MGTSDDWLTAAARARLVALARRLDMRDDAEDVVHDALLRLRLRGHDDVRSVDAWLATAVRNASIDAHRRSSLESRVVAMIAGSAGATAAEPPDVDASRECDRLVSGLIASFGADAAAALLLRHAFELPYEEFGAGSGRSAAAWRQHLRRALESARERGLSRRNLDDDEARAAALCRSALATADASPLLALVRTGTVAQAMALPAAARRSTTLPSTALPSTALQIAASSAAARATPMLALVGGRYVLALVMDGIVLCAMPVGVNDELDAVT